jgi:hypothetical protein
MKSPNMVTHIDTGFYRVSSRHARSLAGGILPKRGYEKLVKAPDNFASTNGFVWLARTKTWGKWVWAIRDAGNHQPSSTPTERKDPGIKT